MNILFLIGIGLIVSLMAIVLLIEISIYLFEKKRRINQQNIINETQKEILEHVKDNNDITHPEHINILQSREKNDN